MSMICGSFTTKSGEQVTFFQCKIDDSCFDLYDMTDMPPQEPQPLFDPNRRLERRCKTQVVHLGLEVNDLPDSVRRF